MNVIKKDASSAEPAEGSSQKTGRYRQRSRTRADIVAATIELLKSGRSAPSMNDIAAATGVSRRTIYLHFPTLEQLLLDAQLGLLSEHPIGAAIDAADTGGDVEARVTAMIRAIVENARKTLPLGRSLIRLTVENSGQFEPGIPRRGARRVAWIEKALAPIRGQLPARDFDRLVSALAMVIGWEALIVLQDVRGLPSDEQLLVMQRSARAIIQDALGSVMSEKHDRPRDAD
mgnify:CR=1 FL=1